MANEIILDVLLGSIILLSMPLGFWRGVTKEVFVSAGILLGVAVAAAWGDRWGAHIADLLGRGTSTGHFVTSIGIMLLATLFVGYGGGALAAPRAGSGLLGRFAGSFVAAANSVVLLGWAMTSIEQDLADDRALEVMEDGYISGTLLRDGDWTILAIGFGALLAVLFGSLLMVIGAGAGSALPADATPPSDRGARQADRLRPVRLPHDADAGKYEPESRRFDPKTGRFGSDAPDLTSSVPMAQVDQSRWSADRSGAFQRPATWNRRGPGSAPRNRRLGNREWLKRPGTSAAGPSMAEGREGWAIGSRQRHPERCGACGTPISTEDAFCPRCGTTTGG